MKYLYFSINVVFVVLMMWAGWKMQIRYSIEFHSEGFIINQKISISMIQFDKIKKIDVKKKSLIIRGDFLVEYRFGKRTGLSAIEVVDNGGDDFRHLKDILKSLKFL